MAVVGEGQHHGDGIAGRMIGKMDYRQVGVGNVKSSPGDGQGNIQKNAQPGQSQSLMTEYRNSVFIVTDDFIKIKSLQLLVAVIQQ